MPLFEYICTRCATRSEILVRGNERPACPECGSTRLKKQASAFAPKVGASAAGRPPVPCGSASSCSQLASGACPHQQ